jgi:hypothetical protein
VFNNALINSRFRNWQRGAGVFGISAGQSVFGPDRWRMVCPGTNGTAAMGRQALAFGDAPGSTSRFSLLASCSGQTGANDGAVLEQPIENVDTFAGRRVVFRGLIRQTNGTGGKVALALIQSFGTSGSAETVITPVSGQQVTLTAVLTPFVAIFDVPSMSGKVIGSASDALLAQIWLSAGSNWNSRTGNLGLQAINIQLADVEVKEIKPGFGDQFPGFEIFPDDLDYVRGLRFYQSGNVEVLCTAASGYYSGAMINVRIYPMRISPVCSATNNNGNNGYGGSFNCSAASNLDLRIWPNSAMNAGTFSNAGWAANAEY